MSKVQVDDHGLTPEEREVKDLLCEANKKYIDIVAGDYRNAAQEDAPDMRLWLSSLDQMMDQLAYRVVRRDYPSGWGGGLIEAAKQADADMQGSSDA